MPFRNAYVLRQQAVYYLLEWLGFQIRNFSPFELRPGRTPPHVRRAAINLLKDLIDDGAIAQRFRQDFERFLCDPGAGDYALSAQDVDAVFWNEPKPLLYEVVPSLLRKLESNWALAEPGKSREREDAHFKRPLPTFIPGATFGELDVSESTIRFPNTDKDDETMGVAQALTEFCPGRVSKRYSVRDGETGYWLQASGRLMNDETEFSVSSVFESAILIDQVSVDGPVNVYQPMLLAVVAHGPLVTERSNGFWQWQSRIEEFGDGRPLPMRRSGSWGNSVTTAQMHLHRESSGVDILRFAEEWNFDIQLARQKGQTKTGTGVLLSRDQEEIIREAVGFRLKADGMLWKVSYAFLKGLRQPTEDQLKGLRSHYYLHCLQTSAALSAYLDRFSAEWIHRTSMAMLLATALRNNCSLANAQVLLRGRRLDALGRVLSHIIPVSTDDDLSPTAPAKLRDKLTTLWATPAVEEEIERLEHSLWEKEVSADLFDWCKRRALSAVAQAFQTSALTSTDGVSEDDLSLDVFWDEPEDARIFVAETSSGGLGHIEAVVRTLLESPESFHEGVRQALHFCPREETAESLFTFLKALNEEIEGGPLRVAVSRIREATDFKAAEIATGELRQALSIAGLDGSRSFVVSVLARIIRPGSTPDTDRVAYLINALWRRRSLKLGIDIDPAVWAYICSSSKPGARRFGRILQTLSGGANVTRGHIYRLVQQMLFEGCRHSCPECLADRNRYNDAGLASRELASTWLGLKPLQILISTSEDWRAQLRLALREHGIAELVCENSELTEAMLNLQQLLAEELEVESVLIPPSISAMYRRGRTWFIQTQLKGVVA